MVKKDLEGWCTHHLCAKFGKDRVSLYACGSDDSKAVLACCAHLAEGRAFECMKKPEDVVYTIRDNYKYGLRVPHDPDFEPKKGKIRYLRGKAKRECVI